MRRSAYWLALTVLCLAPALALAAEGDYELKAGKVYRVDGGGERPLEDVEPQRADTDAGPWAWVLVDPGAGALTIWESSVKDEKDWGDDERTEEGEITVPVPAAG